MAKRREIQIRRVYDPPVPDDGARFLVDRLWPRGIKKDDLQLDGWLRDVAPSNALRRWSRHNPARWDKFLERYLTELDANPAAWQPIVKAAQEGRVTVLYSARDPAHNNAVALQRYLVAQLKRRASDSEP